MKKYVKKAMAVEAIQFRIDTIDTIVEWFELNSFKGYLVNRNTPSMNILTLDGRIIVQEHDWIIRGVMGEFYSIKNNVFALTYEPVEESIYHKLIDDGK